MRPIISAVTWNSSLRRLLLVAVLLAGSSIANSTPISEPPSDVSFLTPFCQSQCVTLGRGVSTYDASQDLLLITTSAASLNWLPIEMGLGTHLDFTNSRLGLTAKVDADGQFSGGILQWVGGLEELGIRNNSLLMTATISRFAYSHIEFDPADGGPLGYSFRFILEPTFVNTAIYGFPGDRQYALFTYDLITPQTYNRLFEDSFTGGQYLSYYLGPIDASEPSMSTLIALAVAMLVIGRRKRRLSEIST